MPGVGFRCHGCQPFTRRAQCLGKARLGLHRFGHAGAHGIGCLACFCLAFLQGGIVTQRCGLCLGAGKVIPKGGRCGTQFLGAFLCAGKPQTGCFISAPCGRQDGLAVACVGAGTCLRRAGRGQGVMRLCRAGVKTFILCRCRGQLAFQRFKALALADTFSAAVMRPGAPHKPVPAPQSALRRGDCLSRGQAVLQELGLGAAIDNADASQCRCQFRGP